MVSPISFGLKSCDGFLGLHFTTSIHFLEENVKNVLVSLCLQNFVKMGFLHLCIKNAKEKETIILRIDYETVRKTRPVSSSSRALYGDMPKYRGTVYPSPP